MKNLIKNTAFKVGFWCGLSFFSLLNFLSYEISYNKYINREIKFSGGGYRGGFPFTAYSVFIGYPSGDEWYWSGAAANILIALIGSFVIGLTFKLVWSKIIVRRLR